MDFSIVHADSSYIDVLLPLFDGYRQFYGQPTDVSAARQFLNGRLSNAESKILIAMRGADGLGFTQLFPSFSSVAMQRIWILNDLFVRPADRQRGVASRLLEAAADFGRSTSAVRLVLATAVDNREAQALYRKHEWQLDTEFNHYVLPLQSG